MHADNVPPPVDALAALAGLIAEAAKRNDTIREAVHRVALWLANETREATAAPPDIAIEPTTILVPSIAPLRSAVEPPRAAPLVQKELRLGDLRVPMQVPEAPPGRLIEPEHLTGAVTGPTVVSEAPLRRRGDFAAIAFRCRLKAEAGHWARAHWDALAERTLSPDDLHAREELIRRAKSVDGCWLWMLDSTWLHGDPDLLTLCAENYATVSAAAEMADRILPGERSEELLRLLAEAQSSLRAALLFVEIEHDADQLDLFWWLRELGQTQRIYIDRHMRRDDPADPYNWPDLRARLQAWTQRHDSRAQNERTRATLLKKVEFHVKRLRAASAPDELAEHRRAILEALGQWCRQGFYATDAELSRTVLPVYETVVEGAEEHDDAAAVLRAVDTLAAQQEAQAETKEIETAPARRSAEVARAAELLRGRTVVLIGGDVRPLSKRRLERDLEIGELRWLSTSPHERHDSLIPDIVRDDVDLVMLAIRFTSHSHGEFAEVCDRAGKPFVRLPGGYGSAQVAHQVLEQISERLAPAPSQ